MSKTRTFSMLRWTTTMWLPSPSSKSALVVCVVVAGYGLLKICFLPQHSVSDVVFSRPPPPPRGSPIRFVNCAFRGNSLSNVTVETTSPVFLDRCTLRSSTIGVEVRRTNVVREQANVTVTKCDIERNEIGALLGDGSRIHLDRTAITSHSKCGVRVTFGGELGTTECTWGSNSAADVLLVHAPGEAEPPALLVVREELEKANAGIVVRLEQASTRALRLADFSSDDAFIAEVLLESNRTGRCTRAWTVRVLCLALALFLYSHELGTLVLRATHVRVFHVRHHCCTQLGAVRCVP